MLLVEAEAIVAMLVEQILRDMGLRVLVVSTLDYAMVELEMTSFDAAVIDTHLRGQRAAQLIHALVFRSIPFMVLSGGDVADFRATHPQITVPGKPFDEGQLEQCVRRMVNRRALLQLALIGHVGDQPVELGLEDRAVLAQPVALFTPVRKKVFHLRPETR